MSTDLAVPVTLRCPICLEKKPLEDIQTLNCKHAFCGPCLSMYTGPYCPAEGCDGTRSTDIVVDEMAGADEAVKISLGTHTLSMLDLEDKLKCDGRRGALACTNVARMTLANCRHNLCYDCLAEKLQLAKDGNHAPYCPLSYCANKLLKPEVMQLAQCSPLSAPLCNKVEPLVTEEPCTMTAGKEDMIIDCSVYGKDATIKRIVIPKACTVADMLSAILQLQRLAKNRTTSSLGIFIRHDERKGKGKVKYEQIRPKQLGKKAVKDMSWPDKMVVVIDMDNILNKRK